MNVHLQGTFTALVTPFNRDGSLDLPALDALVDSQMAAGINGLVPCGTTGEAATLSAQERDQLIARVAQRVSGRGAVIAGTGANGTAASIENQRRAKDVGATHGLVVTPYYNKPTQEGLYRHYCAIVEAVDLPLIIYNVPSRTACDIKPETVVRLAKVPRIVGIKEATGDLDRLAPIRAANEHFALLSGDDATTCPFVLMGGDGVISVVSNVVPAEMVTLVQAARAGRSIEARQQHNRLRALIAALFIESNPIPVKAAMALQGHIQETYRLPLCEMRPENRPHLSDVLRAGRWI